MNSINDYLQSGVCSFDFLLKPYNKSQKVYANPVLVSEQFDKVINKCQFPRDYTEGVYLINDIIQSETNCPDHLKHSLLCKSFNRYFTSYSVQESNLITYHFFNKEASRLIFNLFNEYSCPFAFLSNSVVRMYEEGNSFVSEAEYAECKMNQIREEDVIGFVMCDTRCSLLDSSNESILYILTYKPIENLSACDNFDSYACGIEKDAFIESKYLKPRYWRLLLWAFVHDLQTKAGIVSDIENLAIYDKGMCKRLLNYIDSHYGSMSDQEKDMCACIVPNKYEFTKQNKVQEEYLRSYVVNIGSIIRTNGLIYCHTLHFFNPEEPVLAHMHDVINVTLKRAKYFLNPNIDYKIDAILLMLLINLFMTEKNMLRDVAALWAFYHLINLQKTNDSNLIPELVLAIYQNNEDLFLDLIHEIKQEKIRTENNTYERLLWESDEDEIYFELFVDYSNNGKGYPLNDFEKHFISDKIISELKPNCYEQFFKKFPSVKHYGYTIEQDRQVYKNEIEKYISSKIENNDFLFKEITKK